MDTFIVSYGAGFCCQPRKGAPMSAVMHFDFLHDDGVHREGQSEDIAGDGKSTSIP